MHHWTLCEFTVIKKNAIKVSRIGFKLKTCSLCDCHEATEAGAIFQFILYHSRSRAHVTRNKKRKKNREKHSETLGCKSTWVLPALLWIFFDDCVRESAIKSISWFVMNLERIFYATLRRCLNQPLVSESWSSKMNSKHNQVLIIFFYLRLKYFSQQLIDTAKIAMAEVNFYIFRWGNLNESVVGGTNVAPSEEILLEWSRFGTFNDSGDFGPRWILLGGQESLSSWCCLLLFLFSCPLTDPCVDTGASVKNEAIIGVQHFLFQRFLADGFNLQGSWCIGELIQSRGLNISFFKFVIIFACWFVGNLRWWTWAEQFKEVFLIDVVGEFVWKKNCSLTEFSWKTQKQTYQRCEQQLVHYDPGLWFD